MTTFSVRCRHRACRHRRVTRIHPDEYKVVPVCPMCGNRKGWRIEQRAYNKRKRCKCGGPLGRDNEPFPHSASHPCCDLHPNGIYNQARARGVAHEDIPKEHHPMAMKIEDYTPQQAQDELVQLLVKGARRCAYDLRHAADDIEAHNGNGHAQLELWRQRADMWIGIFDPGDGLKDYRHRLHNTIAQQEGTIERLRALCRHHGIDMGDLDDGIPF